MPTAKPPAAAAPRPQVPPLGEVAANFAPIGYLAFSVVVVDQAIQVFVSIDGFAPGQALTRFQLATSLATRMVPLALGFLVALVAAMASRSARALGVLQWGAVVTSAVLGLGAVFLWFDGVTVKRSVEADDLSAFTSQWLRGQVFSVLGSGFFAWLAAGTRRMR